MEVSIYQICYDSKQHAGVDPAFRLYDNSRYCKLYDKVNNPREYQVYIDNHDPFQTDYIGYVSWKFKSKTGMSGDYFINKIKKSAADVHFVNCGPRSITNVWRQGERQHPGILQFTQTILDSVGYDIDLHKLKHCKSKTSFCNFWVGNKTFWSKYMNFTYPIYNYIQNNLTPEQKSFITKRACRGINSDYFPFIMERLFTTLLHVDKTITYNNISRLKT